MRKIMALIAALVLVNPLVAEEISADCITVGCVITLKQRAQFNWDPETCIWEYVPGNASGGRAFVRGRSEKLTVLRLEEYEGEEVVIAFQYTFFDLEESAATFRFHRVYLANSKAFSISSKTPV